MIIHNVCMIFFKFYKSLDALDYQKVDFLEEHSRLFFCRKSSMEFGSYLKLGNSKLHETTFIGFLRHVGC